MRKIISTCGVSGFALLASMVGGAQPPDPYLPEDDSAVVEHLPRELSAALSDWRDKGRPSSLEQATELAIRLLEASQRSADTRYLGRIQTLLAPWSEQRPAPAEVDFLHASVLQAQHRFDEALERLGSVLERNPGHVRARLTQAVILQVLGRPEEATRSCALLAGRVGRLALDTCMAGAARLGPRAPEAFRQLRRAVADASVADAEILPWSLRVLADIAAQLGDVASAREALQAALRLDPGDARTLSAYADFLLLRQTPAEVLNLISRDVTVASLKLRRALAARDLGPAETLGPRRELQEYFAAERARGDSLHLRTAARAYLELFDQPAIALELALRNWALQREPADAQLVLAAALAADKTAAARPVRDWLARRGITDARLTPLLERLRTRERQDVL